MTPVFAVCDAETEYTVRFMEHLNRRTLPFELQMFTSVSRLCEFGKRRPIELLLISEKAMCEEVKTLSVGKRILLSEGGKAIPEEETAVYKFQPASRVVREVMDCYSAEQAALPDAGRPAGQQGTVCGIYGLADPLRQMLFTLSWGQVLAARQSVLHVNAQKHSALAFLTEEEPEEDLSDLLYFYRRRSGGLAFRLAGMIRRIGKLDILPAAHFSEDLEELSGEEWAGFLRELSAASGRDILLADLGSGIRGLKEVLRSCSHRALLTEDDGSSQLRRRVLEQELGLRASEHTRWFSPPPGLPVRQGRWFLETLADSETGRYAERSGKGFLS